MAMKKIKIVFILLFIAFICSPIAQHIHPFIKVDAVNEKRTKQELPAGSAWVGLRDGTGYATGVERFFSDNFPFRDLMLRHIGQIEYSIFNRSQEVIIGEDGWLSDKKVLSEQLHQLDRVDDERIKEGVLQIKRLETLLESKGIQFLLVVVPMKPSIYPEKFPSKFTKRPVQTGLMRFQQALSKNNVPYIDLVSIFNRHKNEVPLYYKTDMHWNTVAATYSSEAIVNHLSNKQLGKTIWSEEHTVKTGEVSGDELSTIPLIYAHPEIATRWASANPAYTPMRLTEPLATWNGTDPKRALLPPSIMFGNSFMLLYPDTGYPNYFTESQRILDYQYFSKALDYIKPEHKIFILHIYETQLLFHVLPPAPNAYWDSRIKDFPLPEGFTYKN